MLVPLAATQGIPACPHPHVPPANPPTAHLHLRPPVHQLCLVDWQAEPQLLETGGTCHYNGQQVGLKGVAGDVKNGEVLQIWPWRQLRKLAACRKGRQAGKQAGDRRLAIGWLASSSSRPGPR